MRRFRKISNAVGVLVSLLMIVFSCFMIFLFAPNADNSSYLETTATILDIKEDVTYDEDTGTQTDYILYISYEVDGVIYAGDDFRIQGNQDNKKFEKITIYYNPENPTQYSSSNTDDRLLLYIIGGVIGAIALIVLVHNVRVLCKKKVNYNKEYPTNDSQVEFEEHALDQTYSFSTSDFIKYSFRLEDENKNALYEINCLKRHILLPTTLEFNNKLTSKKEVHKMGIRTESSTNGWTTNSSFRFDGSDVFYELERQGINIKMPLKDYFHPEYEIKYKGHLIAKVHSQNKETKVIGGKSVAVAIKGYYTVETSELYLDQLMLSLLVITFVDPTMFA